MRTTVTIILAVALGIGSTACKKDNKENEKTGSAAMDKAAADKAAADKAAADKAAADKAAADQAAADKAAADKAAADKAAAEPEMKEKAGNCPSMVFGAVTKAEVKGKDVVLTIMSEDKDAVGSIQKRTEALLKEKQDGGDAAGAHDQKGTHGGATGMCPVFYGEGGKAKSKKDAKGVTITITPKDKPEELKAMIDDRIAKARTWVEKNITAAPEGNKGAVGGGKGAHGSTHKGEGDSKGKERKGGTGGGAGTGGGGGAGTGAGGEKKDAPKKGT